MIAAVMVDDNLPRVKTRGKSIMPNGIKYTGRDARYPESSHPMDRRHPCRQNLVKPPGVCVILCRKNSLIYRGKLMARNEFESST
ncbi:MAG TPA: hypothetical protein VK982_05670 [Bacteroidales bacterium]|nr:hypothetical protein [Bacteroidales bacterium]